MQSLVGVFEHAWMVQPQRLLQVLYLALSSGAALMSSSGPAGQPASAPLEPLELLELLASLPELLELVTSLPELLDAVVSATVEPPSATFVSATADPSAPELDELLELKASPASPAPLLAPSPIEPVSLPVPPSPDVPLMTGLSCPPAPHAAEVQVSAKISSQMNDLRISSPPASPPTG